MSDRLIPEWTQGDRLAKARESASIPVQRMAELLGVSRTTIANYEHGRTDPNRAILLGYAAETGVPVWWLEGVDAPDEVEVRSRWFRELDTPRLVLA